MQRFDLNFFVYGENPGDIFVNVVYYVVCIQYGDTGGAQGKIRRKT